MEERLPDEVRAYSLEMAEGTLQLQKKEYGKGERLEISSHRLAEPIYLDALELECLSWQDEETLRDFASAVMSEEDIVQVFEDNGTTSASERDFLMSVANEFGFARIYEVGGDGQPRVEIEAPRLGFSRQYTAKGLNMIVRQPREIFRLFIDEPFGPGELA